MTGDQYLTVGRIVFVVAIIVGAWLYRVALRDDDDIGNRIGWAIPVPLVALLIAFAWIVVLPGLALAAMVYAIGALGRRR